jgi:hypothetical protein
MARTPRKPKVEVEPKPSLYTPASENPREWPGDTPSYMGSIAKSDAWGKYNSDSSRLETNGISDYLSKQAANRSVGNIGAIHRLGRFANDLHNSTMANYDQENITLDHAQSVIKHVTAARDAVYNAEVAHTNGDYRAASDHMKTAADSLRDGSIKLMSQRSVNGAAADAGYPSVMGLMTGDAHGTHQGYVDALPKGKK